LYTLGGMVFGFLSAGRESFACQIWGHLLNFHWYPRRHHCIHHLVVHEGNSPQRQLSS
jgi:hypothetical protein